jgi:hypothetical protein
MHCVHLSDGGSRKRVPAAGSPAAVGSARRPEADTGRPEAHTGRPEAHTGRPEADTGRPEAHTGKPEAGGT